MTNGKIDIKYYVDCQATRPISIDNKDMGPITVEHVISYWGSTMGVDGSWSSTSLQSRFSFCNPVNSKLRKLFC
jgi:hypothetical protein